MARPIRPQIENGIYHVFNRGNARERIFEDDHDRSQFVAICMRVKRLCDWSCLSYCLGLAPPRLVDVAKTLALVGNGPGNPALTYRGMFEDDAPIDPPPARGGVGVGDAQFAEAGVAAAIQSTEMPRHQRFAARPALRDLFSDGRDTGLLAAYFEHEYSQREIAECLGCHYSTVSRWLRLAEQRRGMWQRKT
jgi:hypothetical protein